MIKIKRILFCLLFLTFFLSSCQLNDSIKKIVEIAKINKPEIRGEPEEENKIVKKEKSEKLTNFKKKDFNERKKQKIKEEFVDDDVALIQPKIQRQFIETIAVRQIGLLIPVSGKDKSLGRTVINSLRLYLNENSSNLVFKIFDTQSSSSGAKNAFKKALKENIKVFIGPIFSEETFSIQDFATNSNVKVFSLSTDKSAVAKNIIISGLNLEEELLCIKRKAENQGFKKFGLIYNEDNYGLLLKSTLEKLLSDQADISVNFLNLKKVNNLDKAIKKFSSFNIRKNNLEEEINRVSKLDLDEKEIELMTQELSKKETFGELPYDILIVGQGGNRLIEILALLSYYDVDSTNTDIVGTSIWEGLEKYKEDLLDKTFYSTSLSSNKNKYKKKYLSFFQTEPINLNFIINDIFVLLEEISFDEKKILSLDNDMNNLYSNNVMISDEGFLLREVNIYQNERGKLKSVFQCPVGLF